MGIIKGLFMTGYLGFLKNLRIPLAYLQVGLFRVQVLAANKFILAVVFDAIIAVALILFMLVLVRAVIFNGEWKQYTLFSKIISIVFLLFVLLLLVGIFFVAMRTGDE